MATIVFDKFGSKAWPVLGCGYYGKPRKIPAYALIRSVASIRVVKKFWGPEMYQKVPKKGGGVNFFLRLRRENFRRF